MITKDNKVYNQSIYIIILLLMAIFNNLIEILLFINNINYHYESKMLKNHNTNHNYKNSPKYLHPILFDFEDKMCHNSIYMQNIFVVEVICIHLVMDLIILCILKPTLL